MNYEQFIQDQIAAIKQQVANGRAINAVSGGVDSSVVTVLAHRALGAQLKTIFVENALMREGEPQRVAGVFAKLGIPMTPITDLIGTGTKQKSMADIAIDRVAEYACADADTTLRLGHLLEPELKENDLWKLFAEVEVPLIPILYRMENHGITLDASALGKFSK